MKETLRLVIDFLERKNEAMLFAQWNDYALIFHVLICPTPI
jgi:hypothetical protein